MRREAGGSGEIIMWGGRAGRTLGGVAGGGKAMYRKIRLIPESVGCRAMAPGPRGTRSMAAGPMGPLCPGPSTGGPGANIYF